LVSACTTCNSDLQDGIYTTLNFHNLSSILLTILLIVLITITLSKIVAAQHRKRLSKNIQALNPAPVLTAAIVLGIGLGGFIDGIVLHQILQWHEMLSNEITTNTVEGKSINMFWDGLFHIICLIAVCTGIFLLWKALLKTNAYHSAKLVWSGMTAGWGIFNTTEGIIDHHLFKIHNVREAIEKQEFYNLSFIIYSIILLIVGWLLYTTEIRKNNLKYSLINKNLKP
jgi:uncharacterized membrane protein